MRHLVVLWATLVIGACKQITVFDQAEHKSQQTILFFKMTTVDLYDVCWVVLCLQLLLDQLHNNSKEYVRVVGWCLGSYRVSS